MLRKLGRELSFQKDSVISCIFYAIQVNQSQVNTNRKRQKMSTAHVLSSFNQNEWVAMYHKVNNQDCL